MPPDPVVMRRLFLLLTRLNFSDPAHYGSFYADQFSTIIYSDDATAKTLDVELMSLYTPSKTFSRPSVFVGFGGGMDFERVAVGDYAGSSTDNSREYTAHRVNATLLLNHTSKDSDQALALATLSATYFIGIQNLLKSCFGLQSFRAGKVTDAQKIEGNPDLTFLSTFTASLSYEYVVASSLESHRIKKFTDTLDGTI